ncbi:MAG: hypothetical protein KGQ41_06630 [Alphaproteobacteria bacterium]|nr:hypothetical protein [Alphaproteobacteria bacterium]
MTRESKQAQALLRVFEALGVPLIGAVTELMAWQPPSGGHADEDSAKNFAALLSASITAGSQLSTKLAPATQEEAEAVRLKASTLAAAIIAQNYVLSGQFPDEGFNRRLGIAFDGILSLADSFALLPDEDADDTDTVAARVEALTPFIQAVMRFPFGMDDNSVIRHLGEKLCDKATALADAFSAGPNGGPDLFAQRELAFLRGCSKLLARSCEIEMDRMQQALAQGQIKQPPAPDVLLDQIWKRFEDGLDVLRAVIGFMTGPSVAAPAAPRAATPQPSAPAEAPAAPEKPQGIPGNPMSFFVKKKDESASGEAA